MFFVGLAEVVVQLITGTSIAFPVAILVHICPCHHDTNVRKALLSVCFFFLCSWHQEVDPPPKGNPLPSKPHSIQPQAGSPLLCQWPVAQPHASAAQWAEPTLWTPGQRANSRAPWQDARRSRILSGPPRGTHMLPQQPFSLSLIILSVCHDNMEKHSHSTHLVSPY